MINRINSKLVASSVVAAVLSSNTVFAAGFEKSILWSGKYAGQGNAAVSSATGAEALYFNPAGLAGSKGSEVTLNVSPTSSQFKGPLVTNDTVLDGKRTLSPSFGALGTYAINESISVGVGAYVGAGANAAYENVAGTGGTADLIKTELTSLEYSVGVGYKILPGLKFGAAWRYSSVSGNFFTLNSTGAAHIKLSDLKGNNSKGYRFGLQYAPENANWGVGASYRSSVDFNLDGSLSATLLSNGAAVPASGTTSTASAQLPEAVSVGGHYNLNSEMTAALEYVWTHYGKVQNIVLGGTVGGADLPDLNTSYKNQTNIRAGFSWHPAGDWTWRAGYVYTSQVTPADRATATLTPPGVAHSVTLGTSKVLTSSMELNAAGEYTTVSGAGSAPAKTGDYSATALALHTGVSYRF